MLSSSSSRSSGPCSWARPCPKCALLEVIRYRFSAFEAKFGRKPDPDEPLFFDSSESHPVLASQREFREQVRTAASASGLDVGPIFRLLQANERSIDTEGSEACHRDSRSDPRRRGLSEHRYEAKHPSAWELFIRNRNLHRRYGITPEELTVLSKVRNLGEAHNSRDFLFILSVIRKNQG